MWEKMGRVMEDILRYNNRSFLIPIFLITLLALWVMERNKKIKIALVYLTAALVVVFLSPLFVWIGMKMDNEIYYRVWWTLPIGIMVCYCIIRFMMRFKSMIAKGLVLLVAIVAIAANGKLVYKNTLYFPAVNAYHIPPEIIDVVETMKLEKYRPIAVMPAGLLPFLRQYSGDIFTPYGRNMLEPQWNFSNALYDAMEASETYNAEDLARCAREEHCVYVVLASAKPIEGSMVEQGYFLLDFVQGYLIYMDYNYYHVLKEQGLLDEDIIAIGEHEAF